MFAKTNLDYVENQIGILDFAFFDREFFNKFLRHEYANQDSYFSGFGEFDGSLANFDHRSEIAKCRHSWITYLQQIKSTSSPLTWPHDAPQSASWPKIM